MRSIYQRIFVYADLGLESSSDNTIQRIPTIFFQVGIRTVQCQGSHPDMVITKTCYKLEHILGWVIGFLVFVQSLEFVSCRIINEMCFKY